MLPFAPARFSTTMVCPSSGPSESATVRAMTSGAPPGAIGTTSLIGLDGYCAEPCMWR